MSKKASNPDPPKGIKKPEPPPRPPRSGIRHMKESEDNSDTKRKDK